MSSDTTFTLDTSARAGNPACAAISVVRHAWYYPKWPLLWIILIAGSGIAVWMVSLWFLCLLAPALLFAVVYSIHVRERFMHGDANPGVVVQVNPTLVAVRTDLTKGFGSYPAVKVIRAKLRWVMGRPVRVGMRLPTVAVYQNFPRGESPHWWDFDPRPLECATADRKTLERVMASFTNDECQRLESAVRELPGIEPGLYRLMEEEWKQVEGFSFRAAYRASQARDLPLAGINQPRLRAFELWSARMREKMTLPRFTLVTGAVILLCLSGTIGLALQLGLLWMAPGPRSPQAWRAFFILGGTASLFQLLLGAVIGAVYIGRKYPDPSERIAERRQFVFSVVGFVASLTLDRWSAWSGRTPVWLHVVFEVIMAVGLIHFARTVHSVLLRETENT